MQLESEVVMNHFPHSLPHPLHGQHFCYPVLSHLTQVPIFGFGIRMHMHLNSLSSIVVYVQNIGKIGLY